MQDNIQMRTDEIQKQQKELCVCVGGVSKGPLCCKEKCQENGLSVGSEVQDVRN